MPSLAVAQTAYYDTCERTLRSKPRSERPKEVDPSWLHFSQSQVLTHNVAIARLQEATLNLSFLPDNWNGYGSPRPSDLSISAASSVLRKFQSVAFSPENVTASADGGVALIFVGNDNHRAVMEIFGTENDYVLLYDTVGDSRALTWPKDDAAQRDVLNELQSYLRGSQLAPVG